MRASASLLLLLGRLRASLARADPNQLMDQVAQALLQFEVDARAANAPTDQIGSSKYALAACADDIVQNLPNKDSRVWARHSMLARFFNERAGSARFFKELERAKQNPALNLGLLEVMHACLSFGFEGVYRASGDRNSLQVIRSDLYETIKRAQQKTTEDLSPHWRGQSIPLLSSRLQVPVWAIAAAAGAILLGSYLYLRNTLSGHAEALALAMEQVHPSTQLDIVREAPVKPPPDPQPRASTELQRIRGGLAKEILGGQLDAMQSATTIVIRIGNAVLFPPGAPRRRPRSCRLQRRSPPRSTVSRARSTSTATLTPTRSAPFLFRQTSSFRTRAPNRLRRCSNRSCRNPIGSSCQGRALRIRSPQTIRSKANRKTAGSKCRFSELTDKA